MTTEYKITPMRVTEAQADDRMCPLSQDPSAASNCQGSRCMAWRWVGKEEPGTEPVGFCGMSPHFPSR